jgi:hypothetical protein
MIEMNRGILYVSVAIIAFIVGIAANWGMNTFGGFVVDKIYVDASIPSFLQVKAVEDGKRDIGPIGCRRL